MATKMSEQKDGILVEQVVGGGKRRRIPRDGILVPYGDPDELKRVITLQAELARASVGLDQSKKEPVA